MSLYKVRDLGPKTPDHRPEFILSPARDEFNTFVTGRGDKLSPKERGTGPRLHISWDAAEANPGGTDTTKSVTFQFVEPVEVHDGRVLFGPTNSEWGTGNDTLSVYIELPATPYTDKSGTMDGNANKVPSGLGYDVFVPAAGDGNAEVDIGSGSPSDLGTVVPVFDPNKVTGYWSTDASTGVVTPNTSGDGNTDLIDLQVSSHLLNELPIGEGHRTFDIDPAKAEWVHPNWCIKLEVYKESEGAGWISGWLYVYRKYTQKGAV